jgi:hypothetical protein
MMKSDLPLIDSLYYKAKDPRASLVTTRFGIVTVKTQRSCKAD